MTEPAVRHERVARHHRLIDRAGDPGRELRAPRRSHVGQEALEDGEVRRAAGREREGLGRQVH